MAEFIVVDSVMPERILQKIGDRQMAFAESFKGEGNADDGRFMDLATNWRTEGVTGAIEIWLELLLRNVIRACAQGFNFIEFWGWPEVRARDDGTWMVAARIRVLKIASVPAQRSVQ